MQILCKNGHTEMLKFMNQNRLVPDPSTFQDSDDGMTCLHLAVTKNRQNLVEYLLDEH